ERGMPLLYSGRELPNYKRLAFFDKDVIEWGDTCQLHQFYQTLFTLHKKDVILKGETFILPTDNQQVMAFLRKAGKEVVLCILNFGNSDRIKITVNHPWLKGTFESLTSSIEYNFNQEESFELGAYGSVVYVK
ncbi:MAG: alpha-glucosidase C-terminal domain-containing protein, partial [Chitinophagaceae bacterium]